MLDQETKRRIDSCRNMLVGKIPDPKSQVEQITIALIYKFMDDMDNEAVEMGGKASFFTGDYAKYSWTAIFDPRIGGHDLLKLYGEALEKMNQNPNIPQLFRNIFNNAYLPYRDPETLKLFLKEIDNFHYSHSEKLGDAFEYLLSFMGTQGDAGQFRTPRHIIDFIAEVVDPKKNETVLDPACGTAGFMISAYKHILRNNDGGKELTPDERKRLINNFIGYDISPDMVRLSLVNLYLHGFQDPKIFEYDTLTSEERWDDTVDVILANPPFMTPKGGIRPHKRFAVQANRSEVLFVDYIAEHLNPGGRAGIIVPEGIIFQSSNAYKSLRKMLVDDYLWAVVSLPAGVFNPYSGVKTSILLLDKRKSKENDSILFVKIENDGFGLGSQRRTIDKNDLPEALKILQSGDVENTEIAHWVEKSKIADSGDWNLSGERYKESLIVNTDYEIVELGQVCKIYQPQTISQKQMLSNGEFEVFGANGVIGRYDKYNHENPEVLVTCRGATCGTINMSRPNCWITGNAMVVTPLDDRITKAYLYYLLRSSDFKSTISGAAQPQITRTSLSPFQIPLPPLSVQEDIVAEIDGYQKIIDGARQVVENYKPTIKIDPDWDMVELGDIITLQRGHDLPKKNFINGEYPVVGSNGIIGYHNQKKYDAPGVVTGRSGTIGKVHYIDKDYWPHNTSLFVKDFKGNEPKYILYLLQSLDLKRLGQNTSAVPSLDRKNAHRLKTFLPPLSVQKEIVTQIEAEQEMVAGNKKLIEIYEQKIKDKIGEVWGEE
jgi:type I restriction enzyme M protein